MKKVTNLCVLLSLTGYVLLSVVGARTPSVSVSWNILQTDSSMSSFWEKFKAAVIKSDKAAVAGLSQFPISMPYGMRTVRTRAQLIRRYRDVFYHETSAAKCFATAQPQTDPARPGEFTVGCKNAAGDEVIIYSFKRTGKGWAFIGLDNINE